jgi:hypothetical protein
MILPTKGVPASKALITVGGDILEILEESSLSITGLWLELSDRRQASPMTRISYDWFVLALDLLYSLGAIELSDRGLVGRSSR